MHLEVNAKCILIPHFCTLQKKLVVLTTECLPQLQSSCGYESVTLVFETNWIKQPEKQVTNV